MHGHIHGWGWKRGPKGSCFCGFGPHAFFFTPRRMRRLAEMFEIPKEEMIRCLKEYSKDLEEELKAVKARISELEKAKEKKEEK